jgi:hypothetical protein
LPSLNFFVFQILSCSRVHGGAGGSSAEIALRGGTDDPGTDLIVDTSGAGGLDAQGTTETGADPKVDGGEPSRSASRT